MRPTSLAAWVVRLLAGVLALCAVGAAWSSAVELTPARGLGALLMLASVPSVLASGPQASARGEARVGAALLGAGLFTGGLLAFAS